MYMDVLASAGQAGNVVKSFDWLPSLGSLRPYEAFQPLSLEYLHNYLPLLKRRRLNWPKIRVYRKYPFICIKDYAPPFLRALVSFKLASVLRQDRRDLCRQTPPSANI